ncbi:DsbA family protein [Notoacmeibacter marinus]|uniref:DsbA family protein n=1 Tax=Notoacmeibacter marinus TaxID=1876515 RepID=UPI001FE08440|nr:DsbA family protein [Notoacmeibacter marinus]
MDLRFFRSSSFIAISAASAMTLGIAGCSDSSNETASTDAADMQITASTGTAPETDAGKADKTVELAQVDDTAKDEPAAETEAADQTTGNAGTPAAASEAGTTGATIERAEAPEPEGTVDMEKLLQNGSLPEMVLGSEDAPVTIVEYASMTCGHCRTFHEETFPKVNEEFIQSGKVRFILREFPLDPRATAAFMLARCSKDKYFPVVDVLFDRQDVWARAEPQNAAKSLFDTVKIAGFTEESFDACLKDQALLDNINSVRKQAGEEFGVQSTPTFFIDGKKYAGALSAGQMAALIDQAASQ